MRVYNIIYIFLLQITLLSCTKYVSDDEYNQLMSQKESLEENVNELKHQCEFSERYEDLLVEYDELKSEKKINYNKLKKAHERYSQLLRTTNRLVNRDCFISVNDVKSDAEDVASMLKGVVKIERYKNGVLVQSDTIIYDN